jgi:hypothetical protein
VEDRINNWKDCGLANLPFESYGRNETWVAVSLIAGALPALRQMVCFDGRLAKTEPKTMRHRVLHVAALLVRRQRGLVLGLDETWPWATELADAFQVPRSRPLTRWVRTPDPKAQLRGVTTDHK